jgi:hypothetical protein
VLGIWYRFMRSRFYSSGAYFQPLLNARLSCMTEQGKTNFISGGS